MTTACPHPPAFVAEGCPPETVHGCHQLRCSACKTFIHGDYDPTGLPVPEHYAWMDNEKYAMSQYGTLQRLGGKPKVLKAEHDLGYFWFVPKYSAYASGAESRWTACHLYTEFIDPKDYHALVKERDALAQQLQALQPALVPIMTEQAFINYANAFMMETLSPKQTAEEFKESNPDLFQLHREETSYFLFAKGEAYAHD